MTPPSARSDACPTARSGGGRAPSSTARRSRSPRSTSGQATPSRSCSRSASTSSSAVTRSTSTGCSGRSTRARTCSSSARAASRSSGPRPSRWSSSSTAGSCRGRSPAHGRRGATDEEDRRLEAELVEHPKELAEHVMLVDLARNDVGRVVRFGTERVDELMTVERYSHVMHLTSEVSGELVEGQGPVDVLRATLPAGTVSGAPKVRAMEIIDELEPTKRGPVRRRRRLHRLLGQPRHGDRDPHARGRTATARLRCRPARASSPTATRQPRTRSAPPRPRPCWRPSPALASWRPSGAGRERPIGRSTWRRSYALIREGVCALETTRDVVVVRGPDARSWLQGQVSQDLEALGPGGSAETLVLSPQGKVDAYCRAHVARRRRRAARHRDRVKARSLLERLRRFRLRVKAELELGSVRCLDGPRTRLCGEPGELRRPSRGRSAVWRSVGVLGRRVGRRRSSRLARLRRLRRARHRPGPPAGSALDVPEGDPAPSRRPASRPACPAMGRELTEKTIPQEAGSLVEHTVSFTKGCYTGQELVARLDARGGNVARRLRGVVLDCGSRADPATERCSSLGRREVGRLTSVAWSPGFAAPVALAYVRRDVGSAGGCHGRAWRGAAPRSGSFPSRSGRQSPWWRSLSRFARRCATH